MRLVVAKFSGAAVLAVALVACSGGSGSGGDDGGGGLPNDGFVRGSSSADAVAGTSSFAQAIEAGSGFYGPRAVTASGSAADLLVSRGYDIRISAANSASQTWPRDSYTDDFFPGIGVYEVDDGSDVLIASTIAGSGGADAFLTYSSFGGWAISDNANLFTAALPVRVSDVGAAYAGIPTPESSVPTTGSATYTGGTVATHVQGTDLLASLTGVFQAIADFDAGTVAGSANLIDQNDNSWGTFDTGTMTISGNIFAGNASNTGSRGHSGETRGAFFGPSVDELAGSYKLTDGTSKVVGAFGAAQ